MNKIFNKKILNIIILTTIITISFSVAMGPVFAIDTHPSRGTSPGKQTSESNRKKLDEAGRTNGGSSEQKTGTGIKDAEEFKLYQENKSKLEVGGESETELELRKDGISTSRTSTGRNKLENPLKFDTISDFLNAILGVVISIATPIVVLALVYSGFLFVSAQGNSDKLVTARKTIMWTLIGAAIVLGAFVLLSAIQGTVDQLTKDSTQSSYITKLG